MLYDVWQGMCMILAEPLLVEFCKRCSCPSSTERDMRDMLQAQRLAAIDAMLKNGAGAGVGAGAAGSGDLEVKLRRLATDVRQLKDRMGELLGGAAVGQQVRSELICSQDLVF
jgi:hypothetical protein